MKVLVVGSEGQVGRSFCKRVSPSIDLLALNKAQLDITSSHQVKSIVESYRPDFIVNTAAYTQVDKAEEENELCFRINSDGPKNLARSSNRLGATLIHLSTDYVFSGNKNAPYIETDSPYPLNVYGKSKLSGESAVRELNPKHIIIRTSWVFSEHRDNFVRTMLKLGSSKEELGVVSDQFGGPTYAGDIADAIQKIIVQLNPESEQYGTYHFSGFPYVSWYELASFIFKHADHQKLFEVPRVNSIPTSEYKTLAIRPTNSRLDCDKINLEFDINPSNWKLALKCLKQYME